MLKGSGWVRFPLIIAHGNTNGVENAPQYSLRLVPTASSTQFMKYELEPNDQ